jgi:hypothetical protein
LRCAPGSSSSNCWRRVPLVDEGKFGEDGPIDQAATDAWADKWEDEYRAGGQHVGLISSLRVRQFRLWSPVFCEAAPAASATHTGSSLEACRH